MMDNGTKYDVFIVYSEDDTDYAVRIKSGLKDVGVRCLADLCPDDDPDDLFNAAHPILMSISQCIQRSRLTLLILTQNSIQSSFFKLDTILAFEKSKRVGELCLRVVLVNVASDELKNSFLKALDLEKAQQVCIDFQHSDWKQQLKKSISDEIPVHDLLPGNIASGQVFSHYIGYLRYILPELKPKIMECDFYKNNLGKMAVHYFMLLPSDCNVSNALTKTEEIHVERVAELTWTTHYGGKQRIHNPAIHKLEKDGRTVYCVAEFVTIIGTMYELFKQDLTDVNMKLQIARFYYTLDCLLNHRENKQVNGTVRSLIYNAKSEHYQDVLWKAVTEELDATNQNQPEVMTQTQPRTIETLLSEDQVTFDYDATVSTYSDDIQADNLVKTEIDERLKQKSKTVCPDIGSVWYRLQKARWNIFIISKESLKSDHYLDMECYSSLVRALDENQLRMTLVLVGMEPIDLPSMIKWVTVVPASHRNYLDLVMHAISGSCVTMEERMPLGDVVTGLAWSYMINYLPITLLGYTQSGKDFCKRLEVFLTDAKAKEVVPADTRCLKRMISIAPASCSTDVNIGHMENVKHLGNIEPVYKLMGGSERHYKLQVYYFQTLKTCFVCEYATPAVTLHEMAHKMLFSGLTVEAMHEQVKDFEKIVNNSVQTESFKRKVGDFSHLFHVLYFEDIKEDSKALERAMSGLLTKFANDVI